MDPSIYFGSPGKLRALFDPSGGIIGTRVISSSTFATGNGGMRVNRALNGVRAYTLDYGGLGYENFKYLEAFHQGLMGPGPFVLLDPGRRNLLTANQSSATSLTNDTRDFTVSGVGGTLASDVAVVTQLPRTLRWDFATSTPGSSVLNLDKPSKYWPGIPVTYRPYSFGMSVIGGPIDLQLVLNWFDVAGVPLSSNFGASWSTISSSWIRPVMQGVMPPANACWLTVGVAPFSATILAGESLWFSSFMLNEGLTLEPWSPGTGVLPVQIMSLPDVTPQGVPDFRKSPQLTLQEVR